MSAKPNNPLKELNSVIQDIGSQSKNWYSTAKNKQDLKQKIQYAVQNIDLSALAIFPKKLKKEFKLSQDEKNNNDSFFYKFQNIVDKVLAQGDKKERGALTALFIIKRGKKLDNFADSPKPREKKIIDDAKTTLTDPVTLKAINQPEDFEGRPVIVNWRMGA